MVVVVILYISHLNISDQLESIVIKSQIRLQKTPLQSGKRHIPQTGTQYPHQLMRSKHSKQIVFDRLKTVINCFNFSAFALGRHLHELNRGEPGHGQIPIPTIEAKHNQCQTKIEESQK